MLEIELEKPKTQKVKVAGVEFEIQEVKLMDFERAEASELQVGATVKLMKDMGVPEEVLEKIPAGQTKDVFTQLCSVFEVKK